MEVIASYEGDDYISGIMADKNKDTNLWPYYSLSGQLLRYKGRVVVGNQTDLRAKIIAIMHS